MWDASQEKLLMVKVENLAGTRVWTFPKGHPEKGESDEETALREVREETGWTCEIKEPLMDVHYFYTRSGVTYHKTVTWFLMAPVKQTGTFDPKEILESDWSTLANAEKRVQYGSDKNLLKKLPTHLRRIFL